MAKVLIPDRAYQSHHSAKQVKGRAIYNGTPVLTEMIVFVPVSRQHLEAPHHRSFWFPIFSFQPFRHTNTIVLERIRKE